MHLTSVLLSYNVKFVPRKLPKGSIWRGKYRLVRRVTPEDVRHLKEDLDREEKNMFYLRHSYLSKEAYDGVDNIYFRKYQTMIADANNRRFEKFRNKGEDYKINTYVPRVLMSKDAWE